MFRIKERRILCRVFIAIAVSSVLIIGCGQQAQQSVDTESAIPIVAEPVKLGQIQQTLYFTGSLEPWRALDIVPQIGGKVSRIYVEIGDPVREGQILAELDRETFDLQMQQAEAAMAVSKSSLDDAEKDYNRGLELLNKGSMSQQQFEKIQLGFEAAKANSQQAKSAYDLAQWQLRNSVMKAPFDGVITGRWLNEGDMINPQMPGGPGVISLADLSRVKIRVHASEREVITIMKGQKVTAQLDSYPDEVFQGRVYAVNAAANPMTRTFEVQVEVDNPRNTLKSGMFGRVSIVTLQKSNVTVVPGDAVLGLENERFVYVVRGDSAERRPVQMGIIQGSMTEIIRGLEAGEQLVVKGQQMLQPGSKVRLGGGE